MPYQVYHNTPVPGYIYWTNLHISYKGASYAVADGYTDKRFVWWDYDYPYVLQATDEFPAELTEDDLIVFLNKNGTAVVVPKSTIVDGDLIVPGSILTDHLSANCVTSEKILAGAISSNHIAANAIGAVHIAAGSIASEHIAAEGITADKITSGTLDTTKVEVIGEDGLVQLLGNGVNVYDRELALRAVLGSYETLSDQTAAFTRSSVAYKQDGTQVAANVPRFEPGKFSQAIMVGEGTTNLLGKTIGELPAWGNRYGLYDESSVVDETRQVDETLLFDEATQYLGEMLFNTVLGVIHLI